MKRAMEGVLLDFDGTLTKPAFDWPVMKEEMGLLDGEDRYWIISLRLSP